MLHTFGLSRRLQDRFRPPWPHALRPRSGVSPGHRTSDTRLNARDAAVSLASSCCGAVVAYASTRLLQASLYPDPDLRLVSHVARIGFFWRAGLSAYLGAMFGLGVLSLRRRAPEWVDARLPVLAVATVTLAVLQGLFVP